jgi:ABC-type lipoprotein export system ATPase subunit
MVTHDAGAASIADRIVFLKDGRIELDEDRMTRDAIYDTIKNLEVPR